ncbi:DUF1624 domain-containing protein [Polyangium jinanense]|uniref:DUF1624 domain-containing protein n=1 Tax=Polyangium jinanense TaxID=2829994 RepID=UPI002340D51F|nr:heparan-alpha-glucosaminide N-acetyltransferase domain-containing protein [Polyangium jinanense]MDC3957475.1 DUF1624 domain-containing protein [Polyangium jinanense]
MTSLSLEVDGASAAENPTKPVEKARNDAVDVLRGLVMILMAIDHVRDFVGPQVDFRIDLTKTSAALFFTRWITHFCAPVFVLLAGTSAYLQAARGKSRSELSWFLLTRGAWLVLLEITVIRIGWTFDLGYHVTPLQVIWAIGWSMIALAGLVHLPVRVVAAIGVAMIAGHNLLDGVSFAKGSALDVVWSILHTSKPFEPLPGHYVFIAYPLVPWIGVMAAGYGLGALFEAAPGERRAWLYKLGAALTLSFVVVRGLNVYGDPLPWTSQGSALATTLSFLNCRKYPPSLSYLLMTLGPALVALGALEGRELPGKRILLVFGRAPLFYYILHLFLAHASAAILHYAIHGDEVFTWQHMGLPAKAQHGLPFVYGTTLVVVAALYPLCRWFAELKRRRRDLAFLSYL